jgi:predicted RND superfamily exporter protein
MYYPNYAFTQNLKPQSFSSLCFSIKKILSLIPSIILNILLLFSILITSERVTHQKRGIPLPSSKIEKLANFVAQRFGVVIAVILVISLFFIIAANVIEVKATEESYNSDTEINQAMQRIEDDFRPSTHGIPFVVESKNDNVLTMDTFRDVMDALDKVQNDELVSQYLFQYFDNALITNITSINALPYHVKLIMDIDSPIGYQIGYHSISDPGNSFGSATDNDLYFILNHLFQLTDASGNFVFQEFVSAELKQEGGKWRAPVLMIFIAVDNNLLEINYTYDIQDEDKEFFEEFDLHVDQILKDNIGTGNVYGVGVGVNNEIETEIAESGPFTLFVFIVIIIILAVTFRHNMKSFVAGAIGLPLILYWMWGSGNLLQLADTQFNSFLPILILALGVDYAIHSMKRFDEELEQGKTPRQAIKGSILKLTGTLVLAMATTLVAFFSNILSTIPALRDWGIEAGLAIIGTLIIMGVFVPALRLGLEPRAKRDVPYYTINEKQKKGNKKVQDVILNDKENVPNKRTKSRTVPKNRVGKGLTRLTFGSLSNPLAVIVVLIIVCLGLGYGAINLDTEFELEEYFNADSDLVVGLDIYTEHFPTGGEPNILLIEGDVAEPSVLKAINVTRERLKNRGYATYYGWDVSQLVQNFTRNLWVNNLVGGSELEITDLDSDDIPDSKGQIEAILQQARTLGLFVFVQNNVTLSILPDTVQEIVHYDEDSDSFDSTLLAVGVAGSGSLKSIKKGMDNIEEDAAVLEDTGEVEVIVTGTGPQRWEQLTAISLSMQYSMVISIIFCFIIIISVFRKISLSIIAILPVILIAIWLYGAMHFTGFHLNIVTATIGAMSIGVGVDYSVHVCDRFRKEKAEGKDFKNAIDVTISNSGAALLFAALTTTFGFFIMLLAPMPMFYSFGLFSGLMVLLAFVASVLVVPPLLSLIQKKE